MKIDAKHILLWPVFGVCLAGTVTCLLDLAGAFFFFDTSSIWSYLAPVSLLILLIVAVQSRSLTQVVAAYLLIAIFVLSYIFDRWQWAVERFNEEGLYFFPDTMECLFLVVLICMLHAPRSR